MNILAALKQEEAKFEKQVADAQQQVDTVRSAIKLLGGMSGVAKRLARRRERKTSCPPQREQRSLRQPKKGGRRLGRRRKREYIDIKYPVRSFAQTTVLCAGKLTESIESDKPNLAK